MLVSSIYIIVNIMTFGKRYKVVLHKQNWSTLSSTGTAVLDVMTSWSIAQALYLDGLGKEELLLSSCETIQIHYGFLIIFPFSSPKNLKHVLKHTVNFGSDMLACICKSSCLDSEYHRPVFRHVIIIFGEEMSAAL